MAKIKGITIEIGANTSKFNSAITDLNKSLKSTNYNLRDVNKLLKLDPSNVELIRLKQKFLNEAIADTNKRLNVEKQALKDLKTADRTPEVTKQMEALEFQIAEDEIQLQSFEQELDDFGSVGEQQARKVKEEYEKLGQKISNVGEKIKSAGQKMTTAVTLPITAGFTLAAKSASDYEENLNKIQVAFGENADEVTQWANNAITQFGLSKLAATDAVSGFGALGKGIGLAEDDAAEMAVTLTGLSADLASYFNTGTDESAKALEGIFTGEAESLKKFGVVMNETNLKKFAQDQGLVYESLSQTEKTMLRYEFVLSKTSDAQGDYTRTSDGTANSVKTFTATLSDLATMIGTQLLPIITPVIQKITEILNGFTQLSPETQHMIVVIGMVVAAIGPLITVLGTLTISIGAIVGVLGALTLPITAVIAVIGGLIAAGVWLYKNWDTVKKKAGELKEKVVNAFTNLKQDVGEAVDTLKQKVSQQWEVLKTNVTNAATTVWSKVSGAWDSIKTKSSQTWETISTNASSKWASIKSTIGEKVSSIRTNISEKFSSIKSDVATKLSSVWTTVSNIFGNIKQTIQDKIEAAKNFVSGAVEKIKGFFHFEWSLPHLKLPHIVVDKYIDVPVLGRIPDPTSIHVDWYKKAYQNPYLFTTPTVINGKGFGDGNGSGEIVYGRDALLRDIAQASGGDEITINVYAYEGMNVNQLADQIQRRLVQVQNQKVRAYA